MSTVSTKTNTEVASDYRGSTLWPTLERFFHWSAEELERHSAESADESQPSATEEEVSKEVTSASKVKVTTDAPAAGGSGDSEMAKSRKSRHASKEDKST